MEVQGAHLCDLRSPSTNTRSTQWLEGERIGKGSFGEVFKAMNCETGTEFAVKKILCSSWTTDVLNLTREIEVMRGLHHQNIVRYLGYEVRSEDGTLLIFQEWIPGDSLTSRLRTYGAFSNTVTRRYTRDVLHGLAYLHDNGVVHMDIKCENLLLDKGGVVKVADFGTALWVSDRKMGNAPRKMTRRGTPLYMAPEVLVQRHFTPKADMWSLGGAVLQMATLRLPWADKNFRSPVQLHRHMMDCQEPPDMPPGLPLALQSFLERCFTWMSEDRPTAQELLKDPFLLEVPKDPSPALNCDGASGDSEGNQTEDWINIQRQIVVDMLRHKVPTNLENLAEGGAHRVQCPRPKHLTLPAHLFVPKSRSLDRGSNSTRSAGGLKGSGRTRTTCGMSQGSCHADTFSFATSMGTGSLAVNSLISPSNVDYRSRPHRSTKHSTNPFGSRRVRRKGTVGTQ